MTTYNDLKVQWVEKYRPRKISDCVLPPRLRSIFEGMASSKDKIFPNIIMYSSSGMGKTTMARCLCEETDHEYMFINAAIERNIDTLKTEVQDFASSVSFNNHRKCVILDEGDKLNPVSTQPALKGFMEEYSDNCAFIFTCNNRFGIAKEIHSRCALIDFSVQDEDKKFMLAGMFKAIKDILDKESVKYDEKVLAKQITRYFPDFRRSINELQLYSNSNGEIDVGILSRSGAVSKGYKELTDHLKEGNFEKLYDWVNSVDYEPGIYDEMFRYWHKNKLIKSNKMAEAMVVISEYEYKSVQGANQKLNLLGFLSEMMKSGSFV